MAAWRTSTSPCWMCRATRTPEDPEAYLRTAIAWHFGADTGSPFWLHLARALDFDPQTDVQTFADLRRFPIWSTSYAMSPSKTSSPRGYGSPTPIPRIFESGGTTGARNEPRSCPTGSSR